MTAAGWGEGRAGAPLQEWQSNRYGIDIPGRNMDLRSAAAVSVLNACQVPAALFDTSDGTSQRESRRRFAMTPPAGLAAIIEAEIADKLMASVKFDVSGLWTHDVAAGRKPLLGLSRAAAAAGILMDDTWPSRPHPCKPGKSP